ncbi:MAG: S-layer homology domain-containing protein [Oscillospiraceae bacterium]|nr:S-layer homology domain-containing protein [Oscillospiraceae bacterium]
MTQKMSNRNGTVAEHIAAWVLIAVLLALGLPVHGFAASSFSDVVSGHWAYNYVEYCYGQGIVEGVGDGKFDPDATLTRAQACAVVNRADYWRDAVNTKRTSMKKVGITDDAINYVISNEVIRLINEYRVENGLEEYTVKLFMNQGAAVRAAEFAAYPSLAHTRPDGRSAGYVYEDLFGQHLGSSECLTGDSSPSSTLMEYAESIILNWKSSSGHNAALLSSGYMYFGCGVSFSNSGAIYCATNFAWDGIIGNGLLEQFN